MKNFMKYHVGALIAWIVVLVLAVVMMPNTSALVRDKGAIKVPANMQSQVATAVQNKWGHGQNNTRQVAVVFSNGNHKLTKTQISAIDTTIARLQGNKGYYHIKSILAPTDNAETKKQLISKDKTTEIVQLMVGKQQQVRPMTARLTKAAKTGGVKTYVTGGDILTDDFSHATEEGIKKTEVIAAIFIFVVLVIVFRSPVVPLVSLSMVGVAMVTSLSLVFNLAKWFNFPISSFTEVFIVVILFGIGTDYNILLYDQFKASLSHGHSAVEATTRSRKIAGRTILFSGSTVLIGFSALGLANFSTYKSAVGVAVGVAVLLLVLLTLNPFFMATLGAKMFWPVKDFKGASRSKMWHWLSTKSVFHPLIALGIIAVCVVPLLLMYNGNLNYNTVDELASNIPAKQGFEVIQKHFSKGMAEPSTIYIRSNKKLDNNTDLKTIDQLTRKLKKEKGVKTVASVTQPGGSEISDLYVKQQLKSVTTGMTAAHKGLGTINKGLGSAQQQLAGTNMQAGLAGVRQLINGTNQLVAGSRTLQNGTGQLATGAGQLAGGLSQYTGAVGQINSGATALAGNSAALRSGFGQLVSKTSSLPAATAALANGNTQLYNGVHAANAQLTQALPSQAETAQLQQELVQLSSMSGDINSAITLLDQLQSSRNEITQLQQQAASLQTTMNQVQSGMQSVAANDQAAAQGDQAIIADAQKIINDSSSSASAKTSAQAIAKQAQANLTEHLTKNGTTLQSLASDANNMKLPDTSKLNALAQSLPSETKVNQLKAELTGAQQLMQSGSTQQLVGLMNRMPTMLQQLQELEAGSKAAMNGAKQLSAGVNGSNMMGQLGQLQTGLNTYTNGVDTLANGATQLNAQSGVLTAGAASLLNGTQQMNGQIPTLTNGLLQVRNGQLTMYNTLDGLVGKMGALQTGLKSATGGLTKIDNGVVSANDYLGGLRKSASTKEFYIPSKVLHSKTFQPSVKQYMSADKKATSLTVVFNTDPSSAASLNKVRSLQQEVKNQLKGTPLAGSTVAIGGQTAFTFDTRDVASGDFIRTAAIMIIGIAIMLMIITRSLLQPLYILGTLILTYISSLTLTRLLSHVVLGQSFLTWNTPFFTFIMIIALGVDYSIFLMMKYREFGVETPSASIVKAAGIIGAVVISAAVILGGTFAALIPSGVLTLIQVALGVVIGLLILVIVLPIVMSAGIRLTYDRKQTAETLPDEDK